MDSKHKAVLAVWYGIVLVENKYTKKISTLPQAKRHKTIQNASDDTKTLIKVGSWAF